MSMKLVIFNDLSRLCVWQGQRKTERGKKKGSLCELHGVCFCICGSVCACYVTDIVMGIMLHDLSVYICITVALLPCCNIDSFAVAFQFPERNFNSSRRPTQQSKNKTESEVYSYGVLALMMHFLRLDVCNACDLWRRKAKRLDVNKWIQGFYCYIKVCMFEGFSVNLSTMLSSCVAMQVVEIFLSSQIHIH